MSLRALCVGLALLLPSGAAAAPPPWVGFNDISAISGAIPYDTAAQAAANAGASSTRIIVDWSWIERQDDVFTWGVVDGTYWADLARGIRPLIGITGAPRWAWDPSASCPEGQFCAYPPGSDRYAEYRQMMRLLTARYPQAVGIEVGNEPNLGWAWAGGVDPRRYTELLKNAYGAVKSVDPTMPVISGGLAPVLSEWATKDSMGLRPFLQAMYDSGAKGYMDGVSVHPYPTGLDFGTSFEALALVKETIAANGDSIPLWVTELGLTTTGDAASSPYEQGIAVPALFDALRADPAIRSVYVHTLLEDPANPVPSERGYGLLARDLTPKPAYCALAAATGSSWTCPESVASAVPSAKQSARWEAQILLSRAVDAARQRHLATGAYAGLTAAALHAEDPSISSTPAPGDVAPGPGADPAQIGVYPWQTGDGVLLCNTSRADRSYCALTFWRGVFTWASASGELYAAAGTTIRAAEREAADDAAAAAARSTAAAAGSPAPVAAPATTTTLTTPGVDPVPPALQGIPAVVAKSSAPRSRAQRRGRVVGARRAPGCNRAAKARTAPKAKTGPKAKARRAPQRSRRQRSKGRPVRACAVRRPFRAAGAAKPRARARHRQLRLRISEQQRGARRSGRAPSTRRAARG